jgi:phospholipid/cholesterol/gamma-HCH transport system substrate-binding protein
MNRTRVPRAVTALLLVLATAGCSLGSGGALPFAKGAGKHSYQVRVMMANVANLVPNAEVKVNDVTVGTVTAIAFDDWQARLTVTLGDSVRLPANTIANVGQKSLLGAQYLELDAPTGVKPVGRLTGGSLIPISHTGTYPATEDLLIAVSTLLNGSGLTQLKSITSELNAALDGRTGDVRALLLHLQQISGQLADQRKTITTLLARLDRLSATLAAQSPKVGRSLPSLAPGLAALDAQRPALTKALKTVDELNTVAGPVIATNRAGLVQEVRDLDPVLSRVADAGPDVAGSLNYAGTVLFPLDRIDRYFHGDYFNLFATLDLQASTLKDTLLTPSDVIGPSQSAPTTAQLLAPTTRAAGR